MRPQPGSQAHGAAPGQPALTPRAPGLLGSVSPKPVSFRLVGIQEKKGLLLSFGFLFKKKKVGLDLKRTAFSTRLLTRSHKSEPHRRPNSEKTTALLALCPTGKRDRAVVLIKSQSQSKQKAIPPPRPPALLSTAALSGDEQQSRPCSPRKSWTTTLSGVRATTPTVRGLRTGRAGILGLHTPFWCLPT